MKKSIMTTNSPARIKLAIPIEFRIVKVSLDEPRKLLTGDSYRAIARTFPTKFDCYEEAAKHLHRHLRRNRSKKRTIGYLIAELPKGERHHALHVWSFDADGQPLTDACSDYSAAFKGREASTLPFRRDDYVIAYWCGNLTLGLIEAEPYTPQKVNELISASKFKKNFLDASDDCYLVDFTDEGHGHPSVASVFPLPFHISEITNEIKDSLHWAFSHNSKND